MNKTVLFLMNGFGVEQLNSYKIYDAKLTPNLDKYTNKYLFSRLETNACDLISGYRTFSTCSNLPLTTLLIDNYIDKFNTNNNLEIFLSNVKENGKIHLFFYLNNEKNFEHLKNFLTYIKSKKKNQIFVHLLLSSNNYNDYDKFEKNITKIMYDLNECKIGMILGSNIILDTNLSSFINMYTKEIGEKWVEINKKITSLKSSKVEPNDVKEFYVNNGFKLEKDDSIFIFNYENFDLKNFTTEIQKVFYIDSYSMFIMDGIKYPMFAYPKSGISVASNLKKINAKSLILSSNENINKINYYCVGLENIVNDSISFVRSDKGLNPNKFKSIIKNSDYDLIIINYPIDNVSTVNELKEKMTKMDSLLSIIHDTCIDYGITLFVSSLYGIQTKLPVDNFVNADIDFSGKVPFIVIDEKYDKKDYSLQGGSIYDLATTIYKNINKDYDGNSLIRPKSYVEKLIKK